MTHFGLDDGYLESVIFTWANTEDGLGPTGSAIRTGQIQNIKNIPADTSLAPWRIEALKRGFQSAFALPFHYSDEKVACLTAYGERGRVWPDSEPKLMREIASDLGFGITGLRTAISRTQYQERFRTGLEQTIQVIADTIDQRDAYTSGHQKRVAELCTRIGSELGLSEEQTHGLHLAASIHDLGKIGIPAEILSKPGRLSAMQYNLIKEHSQLGYDILKNVTFPWPIADIVLQHHERLDGSGYPNGLKADAMLLESRILAVADVVEAMSSHRPYRAAKGIDVALDEILAQRGILYDAAVVDACIRLFRQKGYAFAA
jgi:HD-GYP domain-containing protein (c-di-GMP phosphodiesterase class II)